MVKTAQLIFAKGKAQALDSLFLGSTSDEPAFGFLAVGYSGNSENNGFEDPILSESTSSTEKENGFKELDSTQFNYDRVKLESANDSDSDSINYNEATGKVTRTYQATLTANNINGSNINQIAIVNTSTPNDGETVYYSATTFPTFYKNEESSITFRISFTI